MIAETLDLQGMDRRSDDHEEPSIQNRQRVNRQARPSDGVNPEWRHRQHWYGGQGHQQVDLACCGRSVDLVDHGGGARWRKWEQSRW